MARYWNVTLRKLVKCQSTLSIHSGSSYIPDESVADFSPFHLS
jgi:hypothetical protein